MFLTSRDVIGRTNIGLSAPTRVKVWSFFPPHRWRSRTETHFSLTVLSFTTVVVVATAYPETGYEPQHGVESNRRETTIGVRRQNARTMDRLPSQVRGTAPSDKPTSLESSFAAFRRDMIRRLPRTPIWSVLLVAAPTLRSLAELIRARKSSRHGASSCGNARTPIRRSVFSSEASWQG